METEDTGLKTLEYKSVPLEDDEAWKSELEREGFTVIRAVAGEEEVDKARSLVWEWLESLGTGIKREEPDTWTDEAWPGHGRGVTVARQGAAHLGATWYLRGLLKTEGGVHQVLGDGGAHRVPGRNDHLEAVE